MANSDSVLLLMTRMTRVERRLARLEELFQLKALDEPVAAPPAALMAPTPFAPHEPRPLAAPATSHTPPAAPLGVAPPPLPITSRAVSNRAPKFGGLSVESLIGGRFFAVLGALGTVIGLALFMKLAYDQGWLGRISFQWRCLSGAGVGIALLVAGEAVRKRLGAWASAGISAAGIAALYASGYAAYALFHLIGEWTAFALLAVTSVIGVVIGARSRMPALSIISFIGAYLVPFLLDVTPTSPYAQPAYLLALLAGGLSLASWLRGGFRAVGALVFVATMLLGAAVVLSVMDTNPAVSIAFLAGAWSIVHAALLFATRERGLESGLEAAAPTVPLWRAGVLLGSFIATAWGVFLGVVVLREAMLTTDWFAPLAGVAATGLMAIALCGHLRLFIERPTTEREYLGAALLTQAGGLLIGVIAMAASGSTQFYLWLGLGVAGAVAGSWTGSKPIRVYSMVLLTIATVRLGTLDALQIKRLATTDIFGLMATRWSMHCVLTAAAWMATAFSGIKKEGAKRTLLTPVASVIAQCLLLACVLHPDSQMGSIAVWWALIGLVLAALVRRFSMFVLVQAIVSLGMAAALLVVRGVLVPSAAPVHLAGLGLSVWSAQIAFVGVAWAVLAMMTPARHKAAPVAAAAMALVLIACSVLHPTSDAAHIAIVWAVLGAIGIGLARFVPRLSLGSVGSLLVIAALVPWARVHLPWAGGDWHANAARLGLHPGLWQAALMSVVLVWSWRRGLKENVDRMSPRNAIGLLCAVLACLLAWCATSFEVARVARALAEQQQTQLAAVSIWWAVVGAVMIVVGFRARFPIARHAGLSLMGLAAVKVVMFDLSSNVPAMWRVVSFLLLGLLMLGVAAVYARLTGRGGGDRSSSGGSDVPTHAV